MSIMHARPTSNGWHFCPHGSDALDGEAQKGACTLMAGGPLLLGGRLADIFGRRRVFLVGMGVFALVSAVCGAAAGPAMLISGRFVQESGRRSPRSSWG